ncbi:unnamed protein product (macronuclear) [Paramecium tetraurelia]|uniref:Transmembrane protein n=1 Tax=Paramecium tetraurelia TaxID=5888 RepID=A0CK40_PARTE|nr:uncharacterized protein GSPATT00000870001 [Paramecium tetraurelia]CAK71157.1 unnamed protein product [Paramecium tetraurelia]|eukprot:XP_001438554.1 hypothetical protein (macronuclear) [Paramecium tetraurelia strain d4-2]
MLILIVLAFAYAQIQDEKQLTNAACVIFSRYYLQSNQELAGRAIGEMVHLQQLSKEEAVNSAIASLVESCLDSISTQETMEIIQQLQSQKINLEAHQHLVEKADIKKYGSKKKSAKKNEILKIIKSIDEMANQQKRDNEGGDDGNDQQDSGRKRQRNKGKQQELPDMSIFEVTELIILSSFALVGILLSYIICCIPEKKKNQKKEKTKVKSKEQDDNKSSPKEEEENLEEEVSSSKEVADNKEKKKAE